MQELFKSKPSKKSWQKQFVAAGLEKLIYKMSESHSVGCSSLGSPHNDTQFYPFWKGIHRNQKGPVTLWPYVYQCFGKCEAYTKVGWIQPKSAFNNAPEKYLPISINSFYLSPNDAFWEASFFFVNLKPFAHESLAELPFLLPFLILVTFQPEGHHAGRSDQCEKVSFHIWEGCQGMSWPAWPVARGLGVGARVR